MVEQSAHLDQAFHALADATRRGIIAELARGERTVSRLAEPYEMSLAAVSKHVGVLVGAGLVHRQKAGREQVCTLQREANSAAAATSALTILVWPYHAACRRTTMPRRRVSGQSESEPRCIHAYVTIALSLRPRPCS